MAIGLRARDRPFASLNGLFKLSVWWLRLGIQIERIKPGHPQQSGRHERMHLTLKKEATRPPAMDTLQQQEKFDHFIDEFNRERPHEALAMKCPADLYTLSTRPYRGLPYVSYPLHDRDIVVTACGRLCMHRKKINISTVLGGQTLGIKEVDDGNVFQKKTRKTDDRDLEIARKRYQEHMRSLR